MRSLLFFCILPTALFSLANDPENLLFQSLKNPDKVVERPKKADVLKVVPHLSANGQFKSVLTLRNDNTEPIEIFLEFYNEGGQRAAPVFLDSDNVVHNQESTFLLELAGFEVFSMEFDSIAGGFPNLHVYLTSTDVDSNYSLEALFHLFEGNTKEASVGVGVLQPRNDFIMNIDHRTDLVTGGGQFRGLAVTNVLDTACTCDVYLYDDGAGGVNVDPGPYFLEPIQIGPSSKWRGTSFDLVDDIESFLPKNFGYVEFNCSNPVAVTGFAFQAGTPVFGSVPIDYLGASKAKRLLAFRKQTK